MATRQRRNDGKLGELILLIASRSENDPSFGAVKLNKLLFYCDFMAYINLGHSITGQEYFALEQGPCPRRFLPVLQRMEARGDLVRRTKEYYGKSQNRVIPLRTPDVSIFTAKEIDLVDHIIQTWLGKNAQDISDESHFFIGWAAADKREVIPYGTALVGFRSPTLEETKYGLQLESLAQQYLARRNDN